MKSGCWDYGYTVGYACIPYSGKLVGIKFGEMAKKGCILILAKFKFGDLEL